MYKLLPATVTVALSSLAIVWWTVPWWVVPLTALVVFYLSLAAGLAWDAAGRPSVTVGAPEIDSGVNRAVWGAEHVFYVVVTNGAVPAKPAVRIDSVTDPEGPIRTGGSWYCHWRREPVGYEGRLLAEGEPVEIGLLGVTRRESGNPLLFIWSKENARIPVSRDRPIEQQTVITAHVTVTCATEKGERGRPQQLTFAIAPDPGSPVGYAVVAPAATPGPAKGAAARSDFRWLIDRVCTTFERIFGGRRPPAS